MGMCGVYAYATYALLSYSIDCTYFYLQTFFSFYVLLLNEYLKYGNVERIR